MLRKILPCLCSAALLLDIIPGTPAMAETTDTASAASTTVATAALPDAAAASGVSAADAAAVVPAGTLRQSTTHPGVTVIMLDPGHGGAELGAQYPPYSEKDMTLAVAAYMAQELSQYDNVAVYLTRYGDTEASLKERVDQAIAVDADFMFSIHFNARAEHDLYGSEVLISAYGQAYAAGEELADLELQQLEQLGIYGRGASTRLSNTGNHDYYGIIRRATAAGIPSVIMEHCFLDHPVDRAFLQQANALQLLGHADAVALAEYLHLKSTALGVDFSTLAYPQVPTPSTVMAPDETPPELDVINSAVYDPQTQQTVVQYTAGDGQSPIVYYAYSLDNGATWSMPLPFDRTQLQQTAVIPAKPGQSVTIRVYNLYKYYTTSAPVLVQ